MKTFINVHYFSSSSVEKILQNPFKVPRSKLIKCNFSLHEWSKGSIKSIRKPHFSLLNELLFCWQKRLRWNTSKDEYEGHLQRSRRILPIFNYIESSFDAFLPLQKTQKSYKVSKSLRFLFSLCCKLLFVIIYISALSMFSHTFHWLLGNICFQLFAFIFLLFCFDDGLVSVTWNRETGLLETKHHTNTENECHP